jgi:tungstate transport system permease protein
LSWQPIIDGITQAVHLIAIRDQQVIEITVRSLQTSSMATVMAALVGLPLGIFIGMRSFTGKEFVKTLFNALVGVPTVSLGLFLWAMFSRDGPLGVLDLLYTVPGIAVGEAILVIPIIVSFTASAIEAKDEKLRDLVRTLGASDFETAMAILREAWGGVSLALVSSFNRAFAELGIAMMLGANIRGITRVLTTAISLETAKGELGLSFALSFILLSVVLSINFVIGYVGRSHWFGDLQARSGW